jgi:hypothetical protein
MKNITQNSQTAMRRLEQSAPDCIGRRAWFVNFQ